MRASQGDISKPCSCSSCFYKNASEDPSHKEMLSGSSKIDKLFLGKFLPMREQKLLDRLVRTRAIYDDIRNQLLAESNDSSDAKPQRRRKHDEEIDTNSAILQLVNLVDKGAAKQSPLSDCCSCCSCDSLLKVQEHSEKGHRAQQHRHSHTGIRQATRHEQATKHRDRRISKHVHAKHVRSDPCGCINPGSKKLFKRMSKALSRRSRSKLSNILPPGRMNQEYDAKHARKMKGHRRRESGMGEAIRKSITKIKQTKEKIEYGVKKSIDNIKTTKKKIKQSISESFRKFGKKAKHNRELADAELVKLYESTFGIDLSNDPDLDHNKIMEKWACDNECDPEECIPKQCFEDKKRSLLKDQANDGKVIGTQVKTKNVDMRTETKKQKIAAKNVKQKSSAVDRHDILKQSEKQKGTRHQTIEINVKKKSKKAGDTDKNAKTSEAAEAKPVQYKTSKEFAQAKVSPVLLKTKSVSSVPKVSSKPSQVGVIGKKKEKKHSKQVLEKTAKQTKDKTRKKQQNVPQGDNQPSQELVQHRSKQRVVNTARPTPAKEKKRTRAQQGEHKAKHKRSSTSQSVTKNVQPGVYNLKRCFCTLKLKAKGIKANSTETQTRDVNQSASKNIQTIQAKNKPHRPPRRPALLPYECEPVVCVPGECNPHECIKLIKQRNTNRHSAQTVTRGPHRSKSTPSQTSELVSANATKAQSSNVVSSKEHKHSSRREPVIRLVDENSPRRQAVRISSTFSFNIDFYKGDPPDREFATVNTWNAPPRESLKLEMKPIKRRNVNTGESRSTKQKDSGSRQHSFRLTHTSSQVTSAAKSKNTSTKHSLRRCFCTLKLAKHGNVDRKQRTVANQGTVTSKFSVSSIEASRMAAEKGTKAKKVNNKLILDPNECEPYFCVSGECDPYQCLKRIKIREGVKSKHFGMTTSSDKNSSVSTGTSSVTTTAKNSQVQHLDIQKQKKRRQRSTYTVSNEHPSAKTEIVGKNSSRQAVRIGSSMSMSIEFSKERRYTQKDFEKALHRKDSSPSKSKTSKNESDNSRSVRKNKGGNIHTIRKNKGDNSRTASIMGRKSQSSKVEQKNKATGIRPILKRCFCTLKLQNIKRNKKTNKQNARQNDLTVMPVQVFYENIKLQENIENNKYTFQNKINNANLHCDVSSFSSVKPNKLKSKSIIKKIFNNNVDYRRTDLLTNIFERSFYSMNVQVNNSKRKKYKLGKYECEPGVCVPGECDPVECQKLIMRRLMKRASTMTSSENKSKTISSETSPLQTHQKARKQQFKEYKLKRRIAPESGLQYHTLPNKGKQAVRIGSNFSFNIEFSKDKSGGAVPCPRGKPCRVVCAETSCEENNLKTKCVGSCTTRNIHGESQSGIAMYHKGSMITPKHKRCFCTLELQKNKKYQGFNLNMKGVSPENVIKLSTRGQNTKKLKANDLSHLKPYECEPNICVPGKCDPHKCLKRIKKRNIRMNTDVGTGNSTTSSMTYNKQSKDKHAQHRKKIRPSKPHGTRKIEPVSKSVVQLQPSTRQAVRIGSNFSFDVEFFKNKLSTNAGMEFLPSRNARNIQKKQKQKSKIAKTQKFPNRIQSSESSVQDSRAHRNSNDQAGTDKINKSTKTSSFLKRCFCTAELFKAQNKSDKPKKDKRAPRNINKNTKQTQVITNIKKPNNKTRPFKLDPYECEPGVCNPGQCNPYKCEKLIKKRLLKESNTSAQTYRVKSSPNSTYMTRMNKIKNQDAQSATYSNPREKRKRIVHTLSSEPVNGSRHVYGGKQAVRIGSNFSFNVDFYKDKSHHISTDNVRYNKPRHYKNQGLGEPYQKRSKNKTNSQSKLVNRQSQLDKQKNTKSKGVGPFMKRCFCTLKFQKAEKKHQRNKKNVKPHTTMRDSSVATKNKLEPALLKEAGTKTRKNYSHNKRYLRSQTTEANSSFYECEPGVCIPGECDPYECLERMNRQRKQYRSECTMCQPICSSSRCVATGCDLSQKCSPGQMQTDDSRIIHKPRFPLLDPQQIQGVKIGSNVSFNIEFYKEKVFPNGVPVPTSYNNVKPSRMKDKTVEFSHNAKKPYLEKKINTRYRLRNQHMQVNQGTESKASATGKGLKRCFCTATLHQPRKGHFRNQTATVGYVDKITTLSPFKKKACKCLKNPLNITVVEISGEELTNSISVISDGNKAMADTTVFKVGGIDVGVKIKKENLASSQNKNEDDLIKKIKSGKERKKNKFDKENNTHHTQTRNVKSHKSRESCNKTCTYCKILKAGQDYFNTALNNNDRKICDNAYLENMETILPFEPKLFRKNKSKTAFGNGKHNDYYKHCSKCRFSNELGLKPNQKQTKAKYYAANDHNLTNSKAKTTINKKPFLKRLFCTLFPFTSKCDDGDDVNCKPCAENPHSDTRRKDNLKKSKSERKTHCNSPYPELKKTKSAKIPNDNNIERVAKRRYNGSRPQHRNPKRSGHLIDCDILCDGQELSKNENKKVKFALTPEIVNDKHANSNNSDSRGGNKKMTDVFQFCKKKKPENYVEVKISGKRLEKDICVLNTPKPNTLVTVSGSYVGCEISNKKPIASKHPSISCSATCSHCGKFIGKIIPTASNKSKVTTKSHIKYPNSNEKYTRQSSTKSGSCRCCICKKKIKAHGSSKEKKINRHTSSKENKINRHTSSKEKKRKTQKKKNRCVCGSSKCAKEYKKKQNKKKEKKKRKKNKKSCVCRNPTCKGLNTIANSGAIELLKRSYASLRCLAWRKRVCQCKKKPCKCAGIIKKARMRKTKILRKERRIADQNRSQRQMAYDRYMNRSARKYSDRNECLLWAESALDFTKVGKNVTAGATRAIYRTITDPGNSFNAVRTMVSKPKTGLARCRNVYRDSGAPSALRRVKLRFSSMPRIKQAKECMGRFGPANFVLHMADRDPKKRLTVQKKKKITKRHPDFECSLLLTSLRKRPCVAAYFMCPWFYPHLLSLLNLWKQLTELMLFLLAIVVWSPCLLTLEMFRMFVCCCLCTA